MNVQTISFQAAAKTQSKVSTHNNYVDTRIKKDTFEKTSDKFDLESAMTTLEGLTTSKRGKSKPKFSPVQLKDLKRALKSTPEKWNSVEALAQKSYLNGKTVTTLATQCEADQLNVIKDYSDVTKNNKAKYNGNELVTFIAANAKELKNAMPLTQTSLSAENIALIATTPKIPSLEKAAEKVLNMEKACGNKLKEIVFTKNEYDPDSFVVKATEKDDITTKSELLDKNLKRTAVENSEVYQSNSKLYQIKKVNDLRNNTTSKVRLEIDDEGYPSVTHEVRVIKDDSGKVIKKEYTAPSDVKGVFDIKHVDADGKVTIVSSGNVEKATGIVTVNKNMTSLDGTKTQYTYMDDPQGNRLSEYKITDKNGKVLLDNSRSFEVISENKFISSKNNQKYEMTMTSKGITVKDLNHPDRVATLTIGKKIQGDKKAILQSLKQMPGDELFKLDKATKKVVGITDELESYYDPGAKEIHSGSNLFVVLHELGHATDFKNTDGSSDEAYEETLCNSISANKTLQKVFNEERNAFNKSFPDTQRDHVDYFINQLGHYGGELGGLGETIAESNALLTTPKTHPLLAIRSQYLQHYFPKTIATLDTMLSEKA